MKERVYISELKIQLDVINERLKELEDDAYQGAFGCRYLTKDKTEAKRLIQRRIEIRKQIIDHQQ